MLSDDLIRATSEMKMPIVEVENIPEEVDVMKKDGVPSEVLVIQIVLRDPRSTRGSPRYTVHGSSDVSWLTLWSSLGICLSFGLQLAFGRRFAFGRSWG